MIMMSRETARSKGIKPLATVRSIGFAGVDPTIMGIGPVPSSLKALKAAGLDASDIEFWEINEAFSIVVLYAMRELGLDPGKINVMGGSLAIGHPSRATGIELWARSRESSKRKAADTAWPRRAAAAARGSRR